MVNVSVRELHAAAGIVRALMYCRVSTDEQTENNSFEQQEAHGRSLAEHHGLEVSDVLYEDFTGYQLDRPELNKLRALVRECKVDAIIINESSRLSRKPGHGEQLLDEIFDHGVRLFIFYPFRREMFNTIADRTLLLNEMNFNRQWGAMLAQQMEWGKEAKLARGHILGTLHGLYGYARKGKKKDIELILDEETSKVALNIINWYLADVPLSELVRRLKGIKTPGEARGLHRLRASGEWSYSTIYYILKQHAYTGIMIQRYKGKEYAVNIPPLIDMETYLKVQKKLTQGRTRASRHVKHAYLMNGGRITCSCGYKVIGASSIADSRVYQYYWCSTGTKQKARPYCGIPKFRRDVVEQCVWEYVVALLKDPRGLKESLEKQNTIIRQQNQEIYDKLAQVEKTAARHEQELEIMVRTHYTSPRAQAILERDIAEKDQLLTELESEKQALESKIQELMIDDAALQQLEQFSEDIKDELEHFDFDARLDLIKMLNVTATFAVEEEQKVVYVHFGLNSDRFCIDSNAS